ncbi:deoxynucleotide monophosphate kinase [Pseudochelatococcus sp. G4_1912]|uniref:deoxynucleotide monophosphate kinase family protein n=1 Tax=Pseudochelatococcus sp. G4_1912 TaxID=3114288 RepID=UPI0039C5BA4C
MIIGLTGLAGSGKTTAANYLVEHYGFTRHRMAGPIKAMLHCLGLNERHTDGDLKEVPCDLLGGKTPRHAMQTLGTEWGRDLISPDLWLSAWQATLPDGDVVVDDVRFANEADAIKELGGVMVRVDRLGIIAAVHDHVSEQIDFAVNAVISNNNTFEELYHAILSES